MGYDDWRLGPPQLDPKVQAMAQALARPNAVAPEPNGYWVKTWPGATSVEVHTIDQSPWGPSVQGWTLCDKDKRQCQIMLLRNADREKVEAHERRHAAGWDHPNYPEGFIAEPPGK